MSEKTGSTHAREESVRRAFAVLGIPPEELAYTMAAYSRSRRSFLETNTYITRQKAADFLETFYFSYGHRSIADMAHVPLAIENISILAAIEVVAEQLWDGQERSTRYQDFAVTGYCVPDEVRESGLHAPFTAAADGLFEAYEQVSRAAVDYYRQQVTRPADMEEKAYERTLKARAFDVGRYCLPMATHTSVGQITSARTMEMQISRLLTSGYGEVRRVGEAIKGANQRPAENPKYEEIEALVGRLREMLELETPAAEKMERKEAISATFAELSAKLTATPAAPTLVKYTSPITYRRETEEIVRRVYLGLLGRVPVDDAPAVTLVEVEDPAVEATAKLLYTVGYHPFHQVVHHVQTLSPVERRELLELVFRHRGDHDPWLAEFRVGYLNFDILMDLGSFRDLHRHRRCQQLRQPYTTLSGYETPEVVTACGMKAVYDQAAGAALKACDHVNESCAPHGAYLLPLATRCRTLFSMDLAELAYIAELRTRPTGHFSYRRIAYAMYEEAIRRYPDFEPYIHAVRPDYEDLMER